MASRRITLHLLLRYRRVMAYVASRRITLPLLLRYRRVMAYVASRRITLLLLCLVCRVMAYMASRRITLPLPRFPSGDSTVTVTALQSGRSPHGGGQRFFLR